MRKLLNVIVLVVLFASPGFIAFPQNAIAGKIKGSVKVQGLRTPANVVVYLSKAPQMDVDLSKTNFVMDQRNLEFIPHVLPVPVGSPIVFPNNDKVNHILWEKGDFQIILFLKNKGIEIHFSKK